jgi:LPXTG-motif cell wall-anchored protein
VAVAATGAQALPSTGGDVRPFLVSGAALALVGGLLALAARRGRREP